MHHHLSHSNSLQYISLFFSFTVNVFFYYRFLLFGDWNRDNSWENSAENKSINHRLLSKEQIVISCAVKQHHTFKVNSKTRQLHIRPSKNHAKDILMHFFIVVEDFCKKLTLKSNNVNVWCESNYHLFIYLLLNYMLMLCFMYCM